jgi:hypothetical protein
MDPKARDFEIERLRSIIRRCVRGTDMVDLGGGELLALRLLPDDRTKYDRDMTENRRRG